VLRHIFPASDLLLVRHAVALLLFATALLARLVAVPVESGYPFLTFYPAIVVGFYLCGTGPGIVLTLLSTAAAYYVFIPPHWSWIHSVEGEIGVTAFLITASMIGLVTYKLRCAVAQQGPAAAALQLSERRCRSLLEDQTESICRFRADGCLLYVNDANCRWLGKSREELTGQRWDPLIHEQDRQRVDAELGLLAPAHPVVNIEYRVVTAGGEVRWGQFVYRGFFDGEGRLLETQSVGRDITERKVAEEQLRVLSLAVEQSPISIVIADLDANILYVNERFRVLTGYEREEVIGQNPRILQSGLTPAETHGEMWAAITQGRPWQGVMVNKKKNGEIYREEAHVAPLCDADGRVSRYIGMKLDITEREAARAALRDSEAKFVKVFHGSPVGLSISRLADGMFVEVNDALLQILGYSHDEIIGHTSLELGLWAEPEQRERVVAAVLRQGVIHNTEIAVRRRGDRSVRTLLASIDVIELASEPHLLGSFADVTERKQTEQALQDNERRLNFASAAGDIGLWELDLASDRAWRNPVHDRIFGYDELQPEWGYRIFLEHVLEADRPLVESRFAQAKESGTLAFECRISAADGCFRWIAAKGQVQRDADARPQRMIGMVIDISERKELERRLEAAAREIEDLYERAPCGYHSLGPDGTILRINETELAWLGCRREDVVGKRKITEFLTDAGKAQFREHFPRFCRDGQLQNLQFELVGSHGGVRSVALSATAVTDGAGNFVMTRSVIYDITELLALERQLQDREALFHGLFEQSAFLACLLDEQGVLLEANGVALGLIGAENEDVLGRYYGDTPWWQHSPERPELVQALNCAAGGSSLCFEASHRTGMGRELRLIYTVMPVKLEAGLRIAVTGMDVTERWRAETALRESEDRFRTLADNAPALIWMAGRDQRRTFFNKVWLDFTGRTAEQESGAGWVEGIHPGDRQSCFDTHRQAFAARKEFVLEYRLRRRDGEYRWITDHGVPRCDGEGRFLGYIGSAIDITERHESEELIRRFGFFDALTQLPNRRLFDDRLRQAILASRRSGRHGALLFLDLDNFKPLNDEHGHAVGDLLLFEVARRLQHCVRELDTVARFGGDEFVVLLADLDAVTARAMEEARAVAEKIRHSLADPYRLPVVTTDGAESVIDHCCTVSMGGALFAGGTETAEQLFKAADAAMYRAKEAGRNAVCFHGE